MCTPVFTCAEARKIDLVDYLKELGHQPKRIKNLDYWYYSPFRQEKEPSFKVNRKLNVWFDYGMGKEGNIIAFGILYHHCSVKQLLEKLQPVFSFHLQISPAEESLDRNDFKVIKVTGINIITSPALCSYLDQRKISLELANQYCKEVLYELYGKSFYANWLSK